MDHNMAKTYQECDTSAKLKCCATRCGVNNLLDQRKYVHVCRYAVLNL
jgi:hypothetical protein